MKYIYIWSLIFEPLMYFKIFDNQLIGITPNISKFLQVVFWLTFIFNTNNLNNIKNKLIFLRCFKYYYTFLIIAIFSGMIGYIRGKYSIIYDYPNINSFGSILYSSNIRPFIEYITYIYYYFYFLLIPLIIFKEEEFLYYFKYFKITLILCLILGYIDYISSVIGSPLLGRHISDQISVGQRFHGISGEPRDACIYLIYSLWVLHISSLIDNIKISKILLICIFVAIFLTESFSGIIGIIIGIIILLFYGFKISLIKINSIAIIFIILLPLIILSDRIILYFDSLSSIPINIEYNFPLQYPISDQQNNIYPIYDFFKSLMNLDFISIMIGNGIGSASAVNNMYIGLSQQSNPNSQLVKLIYENGVLGLVAFILAFLQPYYFIVINYNKNKILQTSFIYGIFVLGMILSSRNPIVFIFLGLYIAFYSSINIKNE